MIAGRAVSSVAQRQVRHVSPVSPSAARGLVADVYQQVAEEMRMVIPPASLHSPSPEALAAYWMLLREPLLPSGAAGRRVKEAVAAAVSVANTCPYCVDMHTMGLYDLVGERDAETIATGDGDRLADPVLRDLVVFAGAAHRPDAELPELVAGPWRAEIVGVLVSFHYLCRMVNVFLAPYLVPPRLGPRGRRRFKQGMSVVLRPTLHDLRTAGRSLALAPAAELPPAAAWAAGDPAIAGAAARAYAIFDRLGERAVPESVRGLVEARTGAWQGQPMGLSRRWCEPDVDTLPPGDRAAGRLALLTALSSYQVDDEVVAAFRRERPDDRDLVELVAWAGYTAARRIGVRFTGVAQR
ncbi:carboxymuconolactone decarboxylase family protein [Micromonospora mangrovi]|uniref:Carboxymuconolactone decarboxylase family protein n=2 Tax=Micromonospora TaxID=1873 RepID=A0AAU8HE77_9ACTN